MGPESTVAAPIVIPPSQYWDGVDGKWSTFTVQVGTPAQNLRVLISTASGATWVVLPDGCPEGSIRDCANLRGQVFKSNSSTTYQYNDLYDLFLESNLGYTGTGAFGFDRLGIGWQGAGGPVQDQQVIAGIATSDFWLGYFGLTPRPTNFSDFNDPKPSFMQTLRNKSLIPSLSWSYTAGAYYRLDKVFGSLILGGYDVKKAGSKNMTFNFASDISRDLTVGLQSITTVLSDKTIELLPKGIFTFVDSTVSHIWLPKTACEQFETALGLRWNDTVGLYLINDTLHEILLSQNPSFTFKIGNLDTNSPTIDIVLPYAAFDLTVNEPIVAEKTKYFPILRAANDTQYTLGRTFLQEAYLVVDYERSKFHLSQTTFERDALQQIQAIHPPNASILETSRRSSSSSGLIGGATAGSVVVFAIICGLLAYIIKRRPKSKLENQELPAYQLNRLEPFEKAELDAAETMKPGYEIGGTAIEFFQPNKDNSELPESSVGSPISPDTVVGTRDAVYEMVGDEPRIEELATTKQ